MTENVGSDKLKTLGQIRLDARKNKRFKLVQVITEGRPKPMKRFGSEEGGHVFTEMLELAPLA